MSAVLNNTCKNSVLYHNDVLSCCTRGGPAQSWPGRLPLQPSGDPSVWLGMLIQVWERNIFMCCIWDLAAKRKVLIICFHTSKQTGMVSSDFSPNEWMWIYKMRRGPVKEKEALFCAVNHSVVLVNWKSSNTELEMIRIFSLYVQMMKSSDQRLVVIVISGPRVTCYGRRW